MRELKLLIIFKFDLRGLLEIEQYANALSWEKGTLEEEITSEELLEREARNIQKEADLETCGHVPLSYKRQLGAAAHTQQHISKLP